MDVFNTLKTIKDKVEHLLSTQQELRDDDALLIARFHYYEIGKDKVEAMSAKELLLMFARKQLINDSSIDRVRRKLQENNVHLRGAKWIERHQESEKVATLIHGL